LISVLSEYEITWIIKKDGGAVLTVVAIAGFGLSRPNTECGALSLDDPR
jgi:hypothetical protein